MMLRVGHLYECTDDSNDLFNRGDLVLCIADDTWFVCTLSRHGTIWFIGFADDLKAFKEARRPPRVKH